MLFLFFQLGQDRYALDAREIAEVLPLVNIVKIPQTPEALAGVLNHRGKPLPVVDLSQVLLGRPALRRLHTRIVIVHYVDDGGANQLLGLIAERATETLHLESTDFTASGIGAPHLGPVMTDERGLAQRIEVQQLLPKAVRDVLFRQPMQL